jgi:hypothetical protein
VLPKVSSMCLGVLAAAAAAARRYP